MESKDEKLWLDILTQHKQKRIADFCDIKELNYLQYLDVKDHYDQRISCGNGNYTKRKFPPAE